MQTVLIIGAKGVIGSILTKGLSQKYTVIPFDLPDHDATDYTSLRNKMSGVDVVVHVAHSVNKALRENWRSGLIDPDNVRMEMNVFQAVIESGVKRLIMASSVHADDFNTYKGPGLLAVPGSRKPASPYGAHKLILEEMGRFYVQLNDFEFIATRFGGVTSDNSVRTVLKEPQVWLSHDDLLSSIEACVTAKSVPERHAVFYVVSDNDSRIHDIKNPFGWTPKDNSKDFL